MTSKQTNNTPLREKIRTFFQGENWKKVLTFLFFLTIAFVFWLLQYLQQKFEIEVSVPVHYKNIPAQVVPEDSLPEKIKLKIQDKGTVLLNYTLGRQLEPVEISLKGISQKDKSYTVSQKMLEKEIRKRLLNTTTLLLFSPEKIQIHYYPLQRKQLPVVIDGVIRPASGYIFSDSIQITPSQVWVYGDGNSLDTLNAVYTEKLDLVSTGKNLDRKARLVVPKNLQTSTKSVNLKARFEEYTEKTLEIPVICRNLPDDLFVRIFPSTVEFVFQVGLSKYAQVTSSDFEFSIDYDTMIQNKQANIPLTLSKKPSWLTDYRVTPESVEFLIEQKRK